MDRSDFNWQNELERLSHNRSKYEANCRLLRTWFIAYGVGAPAVILSNQHILAKVVNSGHALCITLFFLGAVFVQITSAIIVKGVFNTDEKEWEGYIGRFWDKHARFLEGTVVDWITLGLYAAATVLAIIAVMAK